MHLKKYFYLFVLCLFFVITAATSARAAARSTHVIIKNNTDHNMVFVSGSTKHGIVTQKPPHIIAIGGIGDLRAESKGFLTGTEGSVTYSLDGVGGNAAFHWDNPFVGSNSANGSAPGGFKVEMIGDKGNRTLVFFSIHDANHPVAVCNGDWIVQNLGTHAEDGLDDFDKSIGFFSTPLKRLGFGGWVDTGCEASAQGWAVRDAQHSTDGFWTIDVKLAQFSANGKTNTSNSQKFVRIEVEPNTPAHANAAVKANQLIRFDGHVLIDTHHGDELVEVHPWNPIALASEPVSSESHYAAIWDKSPSPGWIARHGLTSAQYQAEFDKNVAQGYRPVFVSGYQVDGQDHYAAIWDKSPSPGWIARHGLTSAQYQAEFDKNVAQGYRPVLVNGYEVNGQDRYAAIWDKTPSPGWIARHGLTSAQYQAEFDKNVAQGYRPVFVSGYQVDGQDHYAAIWDKSQSPGWIAKHGLTSAQYQAEFDKNVAQGYRPVLVSGYEVNGQDRYAAIWDKTPSPDWIAKHGLTSAQYQAEFDKNVAQGYRPIVVSGYGH